MSYSKEVYDRVRAAFEEKRLAAREKADAAEARLRRQSPELDSVDTELASTAAKIMNEIRKGPRDIDKRIAAVRRENEELQARRAQIILSLGYDGDLTAPHYECALCSDTGITDGKYCSCFKRALAKEALHSCGLGKLLETQSFESFSLEYYTGQARDEAESNLRFCRDYAENFSLESSPNLTFIGATGLGKTHLSTAIARRVIDKNFDVIYETAQNVMSDFEHDKFSHDDVRRSDRYFSCDLLIVDDLGTEAVSQYTVSFLYNIINTRLNLGRKTIFNTNLSHTELGKVYGDRITSRLFGEYVPLVFHGRDIRMLKLGI